MDAQIIQSAVTFIKKDIVDIMSGLIAFRIARLNSRLRILSPNRTLESIDNDDQYHASSSLNMVAELTVNAAQASKPGSVSTEL